jgi:prohibitin 2
MTANAQRVATLGLLGMGSLIILNKCFYQVQPGHVAIKFSKLTGLGDKMYREGMNYKIPYFERPIIFNVQSRPKAIKAQTANRDMQNVILTLRVIFRPRVEQLPKIYRQLGVDFDEKVLPSIVNEILRAVIAQYTASQLLSQRDQVSFKIRRALEERASQFNITIDDVSITELTFGKEYLEAIEAKQVAQQDAERAKYLVETAKEIKKSIIIKAQAEGRSIELVGRAAMTNPSYLDVRRIEFSKEIADILSNSRNHVMLNSDILQMNPKPTKPSEHKTV